MFYLEDLPKFFLAFFLVLPLISVLHESGHVLFARLMGAKNIRVVVGTGQPLLKLGMLEIRKFYFWYGVCTFENIERKEKLSNILIFSGGILFNLLGIIAVMILVNQKILEPGHFTYQFTYFSWYYIFFAIFPMPYPGGNFSHGKIILDLLRDRERVIREKTYRLQFDPEENLWHLFIEDEMTDSFKTKDEALEGARKFARDNRPSRIIHRGNGEDKELQNYPRVPL